MNDSSMYAIPPGLRPVRTSLAAAATEHENRPDAAPRAQDLQAGRPDTFEIGTPDAAEAKRFSAGRAYATAVARKLRNNSRMALPARPCALWCCLQKPKVKDERSASFLELSKLLLTRNEGRRAED